MEKRSKLIVSAIHGNVLDVGFSVGPLNRDIRSAHKNVISIDTVIKKPEGDVIKGDAQNMPIGGGCFDSVVAGELIEHLEEPEKFIKEARRLLKSKGLLIITTPNKGSFVNRLTKSYEAPAHLSLMDRKGLFSLLERNGFIVEGFALMPYTPGSSEGSKHHWLFFIRKVIHYLLPKSLQEEMIAIARKA